MARKDPQKFFTLQFSVNDEEEQMTTKVPARKGKSLQDLVEPILENHGLSFESHSLFLDASHTPLPNSSDTFPYGGHTLYLRENEKIDIDKRIISLMKNDNKKGSTNANKRYSDLLMQYSADGFNNDEQDAFKNEGDNDEFALESCWKDIITEEEEMPNRQKVQQEAIWELFTTEINYIKDLKVILDVFQKCFKCLQNEGYLKEVKENLIFANLEEVYNVNVTFWGRIKTTVENARVTKKPICPSHLLKSFEEFEELFQPYIQFCNADTSNLKLPEYSPLTNEMIKQYITWCDNHEQCKRITMSGFLIKPLQRVTKYSLLLKAIFNKTDDEVEKSLAEQMMSRVETFVSKINTAIHLRQEQEKLDSVINRFSEYYPVEPVNDEVGKVIKEFCNLNFKESIPGLPEEEKRFILKEGAMKLVEKSGKKDVYAFLFSDVFVITKLKRNIDKFRIIRQPYRLNKVEFRVLKDPGSLLFVYLNEYGVLATTFILQMDLDELEKWKSSLEKAKTKYDIIRTEFGLRNEFLDDDLPGSTISKNKLLRRHAAMKKRNSIKIASNAPDTQIEEYTDTPIEYDNTLAIVGVLLFIAINIAISRLFGFY